MSKIQIRRGVFETNSSSVHVIAIAKDPHTDLDNVTIKVTFDNEEASDYLLAAIYMKIHDELRDKWFLPGYSASERVNECITAIEQALPNTKFQWDSLANQDKDWLESFYDYYGVYSQSELESIWDYIFSEDENGNIKVDKECLRNWLESGISEYVDNNIYYSDDYENNHYNNVIDNYDC